MDSNRFPLQNAIKKILDNPNTRPVLPVLKDSSSIGDGTSVGDDNFGKGDRYDTGRSPDIALNNGNVVVEVHETQGLGSTLWYRVGDVKGKEIQWRNKDKSVKYDNGVQPSVAITDDGLVVEVHISQGLKNTLWYRLGTVKGDTIDWKNNNKSAEYDSGVYPSVAMNNNGLVVEVHKSQGNDTLWYRVGRVKGNTIDWENNDKSIKIENDNGVRPSVSITDDGVVVMVHEKDNTLWYRVGRVKNDGTIWVKGDQSKSVKYDNGVQPSVAVTNDGLVVEVHKSQGLKNTLWYRGTGQVNNNTIDSWDDKKSKDYSHGEVPKVACNGQLAVETHYFGGDSIEREDSLEYSVMTLPAFRSNWINLYGDNSYCYCACNSATNNKQRHASSHTMNIKAGAPYLYAVLTKDDDSIDFPTGAILTIEGPDGTKYDHNIQEENQLVIMSGSSVRCLIVKNPKPGNWKMTMTVPGGVGFHCECNTVPSTDVYDTITETLDNSLQKRGLEQALYYGWSAIALIAALIFGQKNEPSKSLEPSWMAASVDLDSYVVPGKSGDTQKVKLPPDELIKIGKAVGGSINQKYKNSGKEAAQWVKNTASGKSKKKKKKVKRYVYAVAHNGRGDFIIGFKNQYGLFFHDPIGGGHVLSPPGQRLNGGNDYALPGGELNEMEIPIIGAWREFFEETNEHLDSWIAQPDVYEGREPPNSPEPRIYYYGVYFDLGVDRLLPLFETIAEINLESGRSAAQAVSQGRFQGNYNGLRAAFPGCPPDNELKQVHLWNLRVDWHTIQGWQNDQNKSWYYYILNNLRNQLGITG
ncbi:MAG: NUDIX hydrolase [Nostoc sp.]|uniref:NUDIX hydrolase n=1 Tax=Nostoc sp. TaxID=1180 RepID=UPI002FF5948F